MAKRKVDLRTCFVAPLLRITPDLIERLMRQVIEANAAFIENLNRAQLFDGKRSDGSEITPDYTPFTVALKSEKGQRTDRVTLRDSGDFYESVFSEVFDDYFQIKADDPKMAELTAKYGKAILGLNAESKDKLIAHIKPQFIRLLRAELR